MNTDNDEWIRMTTRKPTQADLPISVWNERDNEEEFWSKQMGPPLAGDKTRTHWRHLKPTGAPPKPDPTQREEDEVAFKAHINDDDRIPAWWHTWHAALAYRDTQNRKDLEELKNAPVWDPFLISKLRKRCGLD